MARGIEVLVVIPLGSGPRLTVGVAELFVSVAVTVMLKVNPG
jgi:hypothetical protein